MNACAEGLFKTMNIKGQLLKNAPLAKYTSWRVGGPAEQLFLPEDKHDIQLFLSSLPTFTPIFWMGLGSNLLVRDGGIPGVVVNTRGRLKHMYRTEDSTIYAEAGVPCAHVARFCGEQGLTGAEFLAGIPGTLGGALKMNAGAFGGATWDLVSNVEMISSDGSITKRTADDFDIHYRSVIGHSNEWFIAAKLQLKSGDTGASQEKIKVLLAKRNQSQPTNQPSCGSVFKNPDYDYAARLIEACDLKGYSIGGAQVSKKHANFIINTGSAKASDIEALIHYVQSEVKQQQSVFLQTEVCIVGQGLPQ